MYLLRKSYFIVIMRHFRELTNINFCGKIREMASSSKQRKIDHENSTEGYIHAVTPVKISRNGHEYFNAKIQEKQDVTDMVCFQGEDVQEKMAQLAKERYVRSNFRMSPLR